MKFLRIQNIKSSRFRFKRLYILNICTFEAWHFRDMKLYKFDVIVDFCSWNSYRLGEDLDVLSLSLWRALQVMDIKTTSMSIVEPLFCEFSASLHSRCSSTGLIRREMSLVVTADFIVLFTRNVVRFYLEIRVTGYVRVREKPGYERHHAIDTFYAVWLSLMCISLCQLQSFKWNRSADPFIQFTPFSTLLTISIPSRLQNL